MNAPAAPEVWHLSHADIASLGLSQAFWRTGYRFETDRIEQELHTYECFALRDDTAYVKRVPPASLRSDVAGQHLARLGKLSAVDYLDVALASLLAAGVDLATVVHIEALARVNPGHVRQLALSIGFDPAASATRKAG